MTCRSAPAVILILKPQVDHGADLADQFNLEAALPIRSGMQRLLAIQGGYMGVVIGDKSGRTSAIQGTDIEEVWRRLQAEGGKADRSYFGFDGARARFLHFFPQGFETPNFAGEERIYKLTAKQKLDTTVPLAHAATGSGFAESALKAYYATNFLAPIEKAILADALRSPAGDPFVRSAAAFALGAGEPALRDMDSIMRPFDCAKWTVVTYLPFMWRPDVHAFLKPAVTKDFAARVGHRFAQDYRPQLEFGVYESLLDLLHQTEAEVAVMHPRDRFDIQSFIWVVGAYADDTASPESPAPAGQRRPR